MIESSITPDHANVAFTTGPAAPEQSSVGELFVRAQDAELQSKVLSAIVELQTKLDRCATVSDAAHSLCLDLQEFLLAKRVLVAWRAKPKQPLTIHGDRGQLDQRDRTKTVAAAEEACVRDCLSIWPRKDSDDRHNLLAIQQYAKSSKLRSVAVMPLADSGGVARGAIIIDEPVSNTDSPTHQLEQNLSRFLTTAAQPIATKLIQIQSLEPRRWEALIRKIVDPASRRKRQMCAVGVVLFAAIMCVPMNYNVSTTCELQPVTRRFVAAPFDGPLKDVRVRPGDTVTAGEVLATIDPREIDFQLAGLRAKLSQAEQEKRGLVVEHDFAGSKIAELETQQIRLDTQLLQHQRDHLEISSPLDGIVVSGDLKKQIGTHMKRGDTMFEVAPLGKMTVELAVPEQDVDFVREGMDVQFFLHAIPDKKMHGTVSHVHPRAELRNRDNVFIAEVLVSDAEQILRPGLRGRAWIQSDKHMLGWNLFHKAYYSARHTIGW